MLADERRRRHSRDARVDKSRSGIGGDGIWLARFILGVATARSIHYRRIPDAHARGHERLGVRRFRFWQEGGGDDRNLPSVKAVEAAIAYIHENPVRRGLCDRPADWRWSSARHYQEDGQGAARIGIPPLIHGLSWDFYV